MSRRGGGPLLPRERDGGRIGPTLPLPLLVAGAGVIVLIVLIVLVAGRCGSGSTGSSADASCQFSGRPSPPSGYQYASPYCTAKRYAGQSGFVRVPLSDRSSTRGLSLFTNSSGKWERLSSVQVTPDGASADISTALPIPKAFAVLRRAGGDFQVFGALPTNAALQPDAQSSITIEVPLAYVPNTDGSLAGGPAPNATANAGFVAMPSISTPPGNAGAVQAVNNILGNDQLRAAHVDRIVAEADKGNFAGVVIDYPSVDNGLKSNFTTFAQALATRLHNAKRKLVLVLPLPRQESSGWNVFAYDWAALAKAPGIDYLVIGAERDQSVYRNRVPAALKYLTGVVDPQKLVLQVSPWSEEKSDSGQIRLLSTVQALSIAGQITIANPDQAYAGGDIAVSAENINGEGGGGLKWTAQGVVSFTYRQGDQQLTVWIENRFSAGFKLEFAQSYRLGGVYVDAAGVDPALANIWPAVQEFQSTGVPPLEQPNPQSLHPAWLADGKSIPDAGNRAAITWHAPPDAGKHRISDIVSEGTIRVQDNADVTLKAGPPPGATPSPGGARGTPSPARTVAPTRAPSATSTR